MSDIAKPGRLQQTPVGAADIRRQLVVSLSRGNALNTTLLGVLSLAVGLTIVKDLIPGYSFDGQLIAFGWFALVWSPVFFVLGLWRLRQLSLPILTLSPAGFHDTRLTYSTISWQDVRGMSEWQRGPYRKLALQLSDAPHVQAQIRPGRIYSGLSAKAAGAEGILCDLSSLNMAEDRLVAAFRSYHSAYGTRLPSQTRLTRNIQCQ